MKPKSIAEIGCSGGHSQDAAGTKTESRIVWFMRMTRQLTGATDRLSPRRKFKK
jgi:hypothetical protein